jgi:hypothetical protein
LIPTFEEPDPGEASGGRGLFKLLVQFALVWDFTKYKSKNPPDFIRECNKGNRIFLVENLNDAIVKLARK